MFGDKKSIKDSERSLISETVSIDGTVNSSGAIDVAGLVKGPVYSKEIVKIGLMVMQRLDYSGLLNTII